MEERRRRVPGQSARTWPRGPAAGRAGIGTVARRAGLSL